MGNETVTLLMIGKMFFLPWQIDLFNLMMKTSTRLEHATGPRVYRIPSSMTLV